ncbi:MAG: InlB B-repeat-containing protein [Clostridia bacterium]|nr:InlB B-repeat-containing protein [Clostridia bacterium]
MKQTKNLFIKLLACFVLLFSTFGVLFSGVNPWKSDVTAKAETVDFSQYWGIEDRTSWCNSGSAHEDMIGFGAMRLDTTPQSYFKTAGGDCWYHGNSALLTQNNGVDILQFIYVNGESARDAITKNVNSASPQSMANTGTWLSNPAAWPIAVETSGDVWFRLSKTYYGDNITISFMPGFELTRDDGVRISLSEEVTYNYQNGTLSRVNKSTVTFNDESGSAYTTKRVVNGQAIGTLPAVPAKDGYVGFWTVDGAAITENTVISANKTATPVYALEYEDLLGLEDRTSWGAHDGEYYFGGVTLDPFGYFNTADSVSNTWYVGNTAPITANYGVDIMEYIYVNGTSARALITANANGAQLGNSCDCWLSNPAACPVYVETTNSSGIMIKLLKSAFGDTVTFTFKKGFTLIRNDGEVIYVSSDITYTYANGALGGRTVDKEYTLTFEGTDVSKTLKNNATIGELPAVPANGDYEGAWTIDGVEITADTVYSYGANKTATVVYSKDITETIGLGDWGVPETESDLRYLWIRDGSSEILTAYPNSYWNDHADNKDSNYGVDIMEYILIDGESARALINANAAGTTSYSGTTFPLSIGGCYAPVCIEGMSSGLYLKVLTAYKTSFKVTFKAGFTLVNADGVKLYTTADVVYNVGETMGDITKATGYTLTFEGEGTTKTLEAGDAIGELPAVPTKEGYVGVWKIDGVEITADTVYNYGENKTAVAVYTADVTDTVTIEFSTHTSVQSTFKIFITPANALCTNSAWNIQDWATTLIATNNGVDIMEYIYINDENIRDLSDNNRTNNTYPVGDATGWLTNSDQCRPVFVETNAEGIWVTVLHSFSSEDYKVTLKAGFSILDSNDGTSVINEDVEFACTSGGGVTKMVECTLSFDGLEDTLTVINGQPIGKLPNVPENGDYEGVWTIDGVEITANTVYNYGTDKQAVAAYSKDITKYIVLENRTSWGVCAVGGEYCLGVLDMREENKVVNDEGETYYLNTNNTGTWHADDANIITANYGVDIMEYIYVNGTSARALITANANGDKLVNSCNCWLSNPAASPVYVETTNGSGIIIKILQAYSGDYFELTLKKGFSLINSDGIRVYLTDDVTYKYIVVDGNTTFARGEITEAELDQFNGKNITLMNGDIEYLTKKTVQLTLPELEPVTVENGLTKVLVGWTTDPENLSFSNLYPAGYKFKVEEDGTILYAIWIGFEMQDGAAVRTTSGSAGIRFLVNIDQEVYMNLYDEIGILESWGVFLVPTDYLRGNVPFVHESFSEGYFMDKDCTEFWKVGGEGFESESVWTYAAAFTNISTKQYARAFSARGYVAIRYADNELHYVYTPYTEENNSRSIYEVALEAYNDAENPHYQTNTTILNYINNVVNLTWSVDDYSFVKTDVVGDYEITDISVEGYTVKVMVNGDISSAVVNGARLADGSSSNVQMGNFLFSVSGFELVEGGFQFTFGAANDSYDKASEETLYFASSIADLDFFLNDYFKRHSGYVDETGASLKVNSVTAGVDAEEFFNHEWNSMSYYWYNSFEGYTDAQGINSDRIAGMREVLSNVPVDDYGYVWSSNDRVRDAYSEIETGEQKMGWPFPNNDSVSTAHWEFNGSDSGSWSSNVSASVSGGLYTANVSGQSSNITFTSNSFSSWTSKKIYTFYAPLLEFEVRIDDATNVEDIYVWYTTSSSTSFSEDKKVSVNEKAFIKYDYSGAYNHVLYLPMYAESAWGESTSTYVKQLKIEIVLKSGTTISGNVGLNYVRPTLDTRMSNNNSVLISSLRTDYDNTGDLDYLTENITRARKAMNFLMQMYDSTRGLKKESYLVGHGGTKETNLLGIVTTEGIASSISQGYWDIMYMPEYDFQSNMYFYKAVRDLAYLEEVLAANNITVDSSLATVKTATRSCTTGTSAYSFDLNSVASTVLTNLQQTTEDTNHTGFWNATDGRFVAGYASGEGRWYDYGYVAWNLEAIYYGIATEAQATAIMNWLSSESELYKYAFAPMSNTVTGDADMLNGEYAAQDDTWVNCQFGGAIMYTSFYDLMARIDTNGADDAFTRLTAIQNWYKEVYDYYVANGTDPYDFYRYYYDDKGIQCQGVGTNGAVGLDREFLESFLPVSAVAYGFFGLNANGNTLEIAPEKPADLDYWKMENLAFNFVKYDLTIRDGAIQLNNVRGTTDGLTLTVALDYTEGQTVYVNGIPVTHEVVDGKAYVTVNFGAVIVEVR